MKKSLINVLRNLLGVKRYLKFVAFKNKIEAIIGSLQTRDSYSQHREDKLVYQLLNKLNLQNSFYIEVGANHPIKISNTYLLYRKGMTGIVIEPNFDLLDLFRIVRKNDIRLNIGIGSSSCVKEFLLTDSHARNSFGINKDEMKDRSIYICKKMYIPVLALDDVMKEFSQTVSFLSIDTEGLELEILRGAAKTLDKTYFLCVEAGTQEERQGILEILDEKFELIKDYGCNLIMYNKELCLKADLEGVLQEMDKTWRLRK